VKVQHGTACVQHADRNGTNARTKGTKLWGEAATVKGADRLANAGFLLFRKAR
jgi:hypothetical protein